VSQPVYSTRFIEVKALTGVVSYTCPAGYRAVAHCATLFVPDSLVGGECDFQGPLGEIIAQAYANPASGAYTNWTGRFVFEAGESIYVSAAAGVAPDATVSGYLLTLP
jgi:hypothetical protein